MNEQTIARRVLGRETPDDQRARIAERLVDFYETEPPHSARHRRVNELFAGAKLRSQGFQGDVSSMTDDQLYSIIQRDIDDLNDDLRSELTVLITAPEGP